MSSIRQQIADYVATALAELLYTGSSPVPSGQILELAHKGSLLATAAQWPAVHYALGDESARETEIDMQGVTLVMPLEIKIETTDYLGLPATVETLAMAVQDKIEASRTFNGLLILCKYAGRQEFLVNATAPNGGTVLTYLLEYRRKHGDADTGY